MTAQSASGGSRGDRSRMARWTHSSAATSAVLDAVASAIIVLVGRYWLAVQQRPLKVRCAFPTDRRHAVAASNVRFLPGPFFFGHAFHPQYAPLDLSPQRRDDLVSRSRTPSAKLGPRQVRSRIVEPPSMLTRTRIWVGVR